MLSGKNLRRGMESSKDHQLFSGKAKPELMLAMEYEDNLDNYAHANYEIQILLEKTRK